MEEIKNKFFFNISESHKAFIWFDAKTGSTHMKKVLENYDFHTYCFQDGEITKQKHIIQSHSCEVFSGHEDYTLICSARNPYSRFFSFFRFSPEFKDKDKTLDDFRRFVEEKMLDSNNECKNFHLRIPDYFIRLESVYDDYQKIPFITQSDFFKSGKLKEVCEEKINENPIKLDWRDYYTQEIADMVYYGYVRYFDIVGYDKNSWKNKNL